MTPGKLDVVVKVNQLPTEVTTTKAGWKEFKLECGGRTVTVALRPRMWNKLTDAAANWPLWLAAISGQMGQSVGHGFALSEPSVQVFEGKAKEAPAAAEAGVDAGGLVAPVAAPPPQPAPTIPTANPLPSAAQPATRARTPGVARHLVPEAVEIIVVRRRPAASPGLTEPGSSTPGAGG